MKRNKLIKNHQKAGTILFSVILSAGMVIGLCLPLRPKVSEIEKRKLTEFPKASLEGILDGSYFSNVSKWYSDSFPFRETLLSANAAVKHLYGLNGEEIHGNLQVADAIPVIPSSPDSSENSINKPLSEETTDPSSDTASADPSSEENDSDQTDNEETENTGIEDTETENTGIEDTETENTDSEETGTDPSDAEESITEDSDTEETDTEGTDTEETTADETTIDETIIDVTIVEETTIEEPSSAEINDPEPEIAGTVYLVGDAAYTIYYFGLETTNNYINTINRLADYLDGTAKVYSIPIPVSTSIMLNEETQKKLGCSNSKDAIAYMLGSMSDKVNKVSVYDALLAHKNEYIYFRTDHHWTALGAYYAYREYAKQAGLAPHELSQFTVVSYPGFLGSYYSYSNQSPALGNNPDTVNAFIPMGTNKLVYYDSALTPRNWYVINDVSNYKASTKYSCFVAGDNPLTEIHNPAITDGSAVLIYKDSFGNAFTPFLVDHYEYVYMIDYRYYTVDVKAFCQSHNVKDVIFMNNLDSITKSTVTRLSEQIPQ